MALVTSQLLEAVLTNFRATFNTDFQAADAFQEWKALAMPIPSTTLTETHTWLGTVPQMQDVTKDEPRFDGLNAYSLSITNRDFQAGLIVKRNVLEDDKLGLVQPKLRQLGPEAARHPGQLVYELFELNGDAYDGTAFFADSRTIGESGTIDNIVTGTGTSVAQLQADLATARGAMRRFKDDKGRPMGILPGLIVVPPELEQKMYQALNANQNDAKNNPVPAGQGNQFTASGYTVIVNPFLTDTGDWYLLSANGAMRPFIIQQRQAPTLEGITDPNTESGIIRREFIYSVFARYEAGYGDPRFAVKVNN